MDRRGLGENAQPTISVWRSLVTSRPGAVRGANTGPLAWLLVPLTETQENQDTPGPWAPVTSGGLTDRPNPRKVLPGAEISLSPWSVPAFACERLQDVVDMQIPVCSQKSSRQEDRQIYLPREKLPSGKHVRGL